jgi:hypothetical protein
MANKIQKPSRERGLLSGGLVALTVALALVASLLYAQPVIRAYSWIAAVQLPLNALQPGEVAAIIFRHHGFDEQMFGEE